jgi:flagellar biogenesis protein FliO
MRNLAWRLALVAALTCLQILPLHATEGAPEPAPSSSPSSIIDPASTEASADKKPTPEEPAAPAASPSVEKKPISPSVPGMDEFGRLLGYVTLLAALAGAAVYLIKFGLPMHRNRSKEERKLQVVEMRPLGNRQFLIVVGYEETRMLLGVTPGKIDYLCALDSPSSENSDFARLVDNAEKKGFAP